MSTNSAGRLPGSGGTSISKPAAGADREEAFRDDLRVEVTLETDDLRINGSWRFDRGCTPLAFFCGMAIMLAMARYAERAQSAEAAEARAA